MSRRKAPEPPSPLQTSQAAIQAQLEALPDILAAQREFQPQLAEIQLGIAEDLAPRQAQLELGLQQQFGPQLAQAQVAQRDVLDPSITAGQRAVSGFLEGGAVDEFTRTTSEALRSFLAADEEVLTDPQRRRVEQDIRSAQNVRGFGIRSPLGALAEASELEGLRQNIRQSRLSAQLGVAGQQLGARQQAAGVGLSAAGRGFAAPQFQTQFQTPQTLVQGPTPGQVFGATQQQFQGRLQQFGVEQQQRRATGGLIGGGIGALFGAPAAGAQVGAGIGGLL